ncbi:MAG TPA: protein kinase, partial [Kofleriaceae bacterium]|nr:protein kinase [Kofleriaceae bacterium]
MALGGRAVAAIGLLTALVCVVAAPGLAEAGRVVVAETYAESDLADEAGGFTLLLRAALDVPGRPVVASQELRGVVIELDKVDAVMKKLDGDALVACDLERDGTGLRVSVVAVGRDGTVAAAGTVTAGDGDLARLVAETVRLAGPVVGSEAAVPQVSLGQLRPFVRASAALARGDVALAATFLESAESIIPLKVAAIGSTLRPGWSGAAVDQPTAVTIALAAGTPQDVLDVAQAGSPRDHAARAIAAIATADTDGAAAELKQAGTDPLAAIAAARLAARKGQSDKLATAVGKLLERSPAYVPALVLVAELPAGAVPAALEDKAMQLAAADPRLSRLASALALRAAQRGGGDLNVILAAIHVVDLDENELGRLEPIVTRAAADGKRPALRLAAELAARKGDPALVDAAVKKWLGVAADDPSAQLFRGRLAIAAMRLDEAKVAFAAAKADRELARVAIEAGDWTTAESLLLALPEDSAERHLVEARLALAKKDPVAARKSLDLARALSPASGRVLAALADTMELTKDAAASKTRALALQLAPPRANAVDVGSKPGAGVGDGSGGPVVREAALDSAIADSLAPLVAALPLPDSGGVAVVQLPSPSPGLFSLRVPHPEPLRRPLIAALEQRGVTVASDAGPAVLARNKVVEPLARDRLDALADDLNAPFVVLYQVKASGPDAQVRLVGFDRKSGTAHEVTGKAPGSRGLVGWNRGRLQLIGAIVLALLLVAGYFLIRGRSRIVVEITLDPDGSEEALCIEISGSPSRPQITDPSRWRKDTRKAGLELTSRKARLAGPRTVFPVPPGTWYAHVYGVYVRDHADRVVPPVHTHKVEVMRGKVAVAKVDLGLAVAEVKVAVHDTRRGGIGVWLDNNELGGKVYTDADGHATLYATVGQHTLVIEAHDQRFEKPLPIAAAQIQKVMINLVRERRLAEVADGIEFEPGQARPSDDAAPLPTAATQAMPPTLQPQPPGPPAVTAPISMGTQPRATLSDEPDLGTRVLGRYKIESELGRGAMGVVFKAWDENLERTVAVKVLARSVREIPQAMTLFLSEAKALAQLNHPNIVAVHDQATDENDTYIIMEFVDGTTVDRLLEERGGKLPIRTALGVIDQLCSGLAYAHGKKVVHRDIKPANIFVSRDKVVKLGDFGIARVLREIEIRQTDVRGTPLYMAPEQINGTNINHRADLYALGCTLFELVAGRPPFLDGNVMAHHLFTEPPPLSSLADEVP